MSGFLDFYDWGLMDAAIDLFENGVYAVRKAGKFIVKGVGKAGEIVVSGVKELARVLVEQQKKLAEEARLRRIERERKREENRLKALAMQKDVAYERIDSLIADSRVSAENTEKLLEKARAEANAVLAAYNSASGTDAFGAFDCSKAERKIAKLLERLEQSERRIGGDNTVSLLDKIKQSVKSAGDAQAVREKMNAVSGNEAMVAEVQIDIASVRMETEVLQRAADSLKDLAKDIADISVEISASNLGDLEKIKRIVGELDVTDYEAIKQAYRKTDEIVAELMRNADASKNVRLAAFLQSRIAAIQDRLNRIEGESAPVQTESTDYEKYFALLTEAEESYAILSDGRMKYRTGEVNDRIAAVRMLVSARRDILEIQKSVEWLKERAAEYTAHCAEYEEYIKLLDECNELAVSLKAPQEYDNYSFDKAALAKQTARLNRLKTEYRDTLRRNNRATLIARSTAEFTDDDYSFLGEYAAGDEAGTIQLLFAKKGEAGAIHVVRADLNGRVQTFTAGMKIKKGGAELSTVGTEIVGKSCAAMCANHEKKLKEFDEATGFATIKTKSVTPPDSPAAAKIPPVSFDLEHSAMKECMNEYCKATGSILVEKNGALEFVSIADGGAARTQGTVIADGNGGAVKTPASQKKPSALAADLKKK